MSDFPLKGTRERALVLLTGILVDVESLKSQRRSRSTAEAIEEKLHLTLIALGYSAEDLQYAIHLINRLRSEDREPDEADLPLHILQERVPDLKITAKRAVPREDGTHHINFDFHCTSCGGWVMSVPDDQSDDGAATCKACGLEFGRYGDVKTLATHIGRAWLNANN